MIHVPILNHPYTGLRKRLQLKPSRAVEQIKLGEYYMAKAAQAVEQIQTLEIDYDAIVKMDSFNQLVQKKNGFLFTTTFLFLVAYALLPILAFTDALQAKAVGQITWVWIYSLSLFLMTIILCTLYVKRAQKFDKAAAAVIAEYQQKKGGK